MADVKVTKDLARVGVLIFAALGGTAGRVGAAPAAPEAPGTNAAPVVILQCDASAAPWRTRPESFRTIWRYWEAWESEIFKTDSGEIVRADPFRPLAAAKGADGNPTIGPDGKPQVELRKAKRPAGSALPPDGWQQADFDDGAWTRHEGPMLEGWRCLSLVCARGKFEVKDPAAVSGLTLSVGFRGGLVAYLNGKEVGRAYLPEGKLTTETLAEVYPPEAYVAPSGLLLNERTEMSGDYSTFVLTSQAAQRYGKQFKDEEALSRFRLRCRRLEVKIPSSALRKGTNVLALEAHRAPANEIMYKAMANHKEVMRSLAATWGIHILFLGRVAPGLWWNHVGMEDIRLSAAPGATGVVPNIGRPAGFQVWNESVFKRVLPTQYGDPTEMLGPVRIRAVPNGRFAGQLVVGSSDTIRDLKVEVTDLKGARGGAIPASAVEVGYGRWMAYGGWPGKWQYDALDPESPAEVPVLKTPPWNANLSMGGVTGAVQPVWLTVQVPGDARAGTYTGKVTIRADGQKEIQTPLEVRVVSDYVMPDANRFATYMGILESPDSVALQYKAPLWSEEHWRLLDKTFEVLGQVGNRELYVPLITKTMLGNEQSMVRWVKEGDGSYKHDFTVAERYVDLAVKHHWNVSVTCLAVSDGTLGSALWYSGKPRNPPAVTVVDAGSGQVGEMDAPPWGTEQSKAFWKPVVEGMQAILRKRGLEKSMMFGFVVQNQVLPETVGDLKALAPQARWWEYTHWSKKRKGNDAAWQDVGRMSWAYGTPLPVFWDPDEDKPHYAWRNLAPDLYFVAAPRAKGQINVGETGELSIFRLTCESTMLGSHGGHELIPEFRAFCGFGEVGADFWPVLPSPDGRELKRLDSRYVGWGSLSLSDTMQSLMGAGKKAPAHSCRTQMLRESLQEAEARIVVQDALLDESSAAKLGAQAAAFRQLCDDRTRMFFYCTLYFGENGQEFGRVFNQEQWDAQTEKLYQAADAVARMRGR